MLRLILIAVVLAGLAFRFYHLDYKVFWEDEIIGTVHTLGHTELEIAAASPGIADAAGLQRYFRFTPGERYPNGPARTVAALAAEDPQHPPVYYVLCRLWVELFGTSAAAIRSLSALFGVLVLPCMYWLCLELFASKRTAWIAVALVAISPFQVLYSQEAREYTLWSVATLLLCVAFLRACRSERVAAWAWYCAALVFNLYVFPISALVVAGQGAYLLVLARGKLDRAFLSFLACALAGLLAFAPWLVSMAHSNGLRGGMTGIMSAHESRAAALATFVRNLRAPFFDFGRFQLGPLSSTVLNTVLAALAFAITGYAVYRLVRDVPERTWSFIVFALLLSTTPLLLSDLLLGSELVVQTRYFVPLYLGADVSVAFLISAWLAPAATSGQRCAGAVLCAVLVTGGIASCAISSQAATWATKDFERNREVAAIVNGAARPLVVSDYRTDRALGLAYYLDPQVPMRLDLSCSECAPAAKQRKDLLNGSDGFENVFLVGPSLGLTREVSRLSRRQDAAAFTTIKVETFPEHSGPLDMFRTP
jgi:uncharacterized membrane protein